MEARSNGDAIGPDVTISTTSDTLNNTLKNKLDASHVQILDLSGECAP